MLKTGIAVDLWERGKNAEKAQICLGTMHVFGNCPSKNLYEAWQTGDVSESRKLKSGPRA